MLSLKREGAKLTFTPIFMQAVASTIKKYPLINIAVDGDSIIKKKHINLGMAAALPDGNLIVPVIKNADQLNLVGMTKAVNDLANRARNNALKPDDSSRWYLYRYQCWWFWFCDGNSNHQPATSCYSRLREQLRKVPAVIETSEGDFIGIQTKNVCLSFL